MFCTYARMNEAFFGERWRGLTKLKKLPRPSNNNVLRQLEHYSLSAMGNSQNESLKQGRFVICQREKSAAT